MAKLDTLGTMARELALAFEPLTTAFEDPGALHDFVASRFGFDLVETPSPLESIREPSANVTSAVKGGNVEQAEIPALLVALNSAISSILNLNDSTGTTDEFRQEFPRQLIDYLIVERLLGHQPRWGYLIMVFGLIRLENVPETTSRAAYVRRVFAVDDLGDFLSDPLGYCKASYRWGQPAFAGEAMVGGLYGLLESLGSRVRQVPVEEQTLEQLMLGAPSPDDCYTTDLELVFLESNKDPTLFSAGVGLFLLPENTTQKPGFALLPFATSGFDRAIGVREDLTLSFRANVDLTGGFGILVRPDEDVQVLAGLASGTPSAVGTEFRTILKLAAPDDPILLLGSPDGTRLQCGGVSTEGGTRFHSSGGFEVFTEFGIEGGKLVIKPKSGEKDGFLAELLPENGFEIDFDLGVGFSTKRGVYFRGSGGFEIPLASHLQIGPIEIVTATLGVHFKDEAVPVDLIATIRGDLSVLKATVQDVGLTANFTFPKDARNPKNPNGNLGAVNLELGFKPPKGVGIAVDSGPVSGGGYLYFDREAGRYAGAIELKVLSIGVKAFGVVDTKFPDGTEGYSFVIVIIAEFTPIQLSFGFTLLGVGGLVGINRSVNSDALLAAVRSGALDNVLFPHDVVANAPAIINDLAAVFPASKGHYIFGPMGKIGWGTPTLISADIGILFEFPGPRLGLVGVVRMQLPTPDMALLSLHMSVGGLLDFPAKNCSVDASLYDSNVVGMPVTGDMAFRMRYGSKPTFLVSVGGFNPGFTTPPAFPKLRACSVDLGVNGNPSLVASGYFALTSNSAQIGASIDLRASGAGISLHGWMNYDAMFVFSPFSFKAGISAGVRVSFHGVGIGLNLGGTLSGPSPWHFSGRVCVSVLWWDACLPIDITFGKKTPASLDEVDPWFGKLTGEDERTFVTGLRSAVEDGRNWSGSAPPGGFSVVALAAAATDAPPPIDPLGPATLRQKVCPLEVKMQKFGEYKPKDHDLFKFTSATINGEEPYGPDKITWVMEDFVPGHYLALSNDKMLSRDSYEEMKAGFTIAPDGLKIGVQGHQSLEFDTFLINDAGERSKDPTPFRLTEEQLRATLARCASAMGGVRRSGSNRYMLNGRPKRITLGPRAYVVADACTGIADTSITPTPVPRIDAEQALDAYLKSRPLEAGNFAVLLAAA